jgi:A/G-specific adenine glycosylase
MDLGATVCTPRKPACAICPLRPHCRAARRGDPLEFPVRAQKRPRGAWHGVSFVPWRLDGTVLMRRRPPRGLLGGMMEVFGSPWGAAVDEPLAHAPFAAPWREAGTVEHGFTHATLSVRVFSSPVPGNAPTPDGGAWMAPEDAGLPTLMRKVVARGLSLRP